MAVPFFTLERQTAEVGNALKQALDSVMTHRQFILGPEVTELEEKVASYCGVDHAVGVSSGSDALLLSLMALDIGPKDEVITSPFTFFATTGAIARLGATPVFVDIEADSFNIDPQKVKRAITPKTKAVIPIHLFGRCADMEALEDLGLPLIEDAAQAFGAMHEDKKAGAMGNLGCFSFFPAKKPWRRGRRGNGHNQ